MSFITLGIGFFDFYARATQRQINAFNNYKRTRSYDNSHYLLIIKTVRNYNSIETEYFYYFTKFVKQTFYGSSTSLTSYYKLNTNTIRFYSSVKTIGVKNKKILNIKILLEFELLALVSEINLSTASYVNYNSIYSSLLKHDSFFNNIGFYISDNLTSDEAKYFYLNKLTIKLIKLVFVIDSYKTHAGNVSKYLSRLMLDDVSSLLQLYKTLNALTVFSNVAQKKYYVFSMIIDFTNTYVEQVKLKFKFERRDVYISFAILSKNINILNRLVTFNSSFDNAVTYYYYQVSAHKLISLISSMTNDNLLTNLDTNFVSEVSSNNFMFSGYNNISNYISREI